MGTVNRLRCSLLYNTKVYICRLTIRECAHLYHFSVLLMYHIIIRKIEKKRTPKVIRWRMVFLFLFFTPAPVLWLVFLCLWKTTYNAICNILSLPQNFFTLWRSTANALSICTDARVTHGSVLKLHGGWGFGRSEKSTLCLFSRKFVSTFAGICIFAPTLSYYPNEYLVFFRQTALEYYQTGDPNGMFHKMGNTTYFYPFVFQVEVVLSLPASVRPSVGLSVNFTLSTQ